MSVVLSVRLTEIINELMKNHQNEKVFPIGDGKARLILDRTRWKYLVYIDSQKAEREPHEFAVVLETFIRGADVDLELSPVQPPWLEPVKSFDPVMSSKLVTGSAHFQLRYLGSRIDSDDSTANRLRGLVEKTGVLHIHYFQYDLAKRGQLMDDFLEPLTGKERKDFRDEIVEATKSPTLQVRRSDDARELLADYADKLEIDGLCFEEHWDSHVFKNQESNTKEERFPKTVSFKKGQIRVDNRHGYASPILKANLTKEFTVRDYLNIIAKIKEKVKPLTERIPLCLEMKTSLESVRKLDFTGSGKVSIRYYTDEFGASYYRTEVFSLGQDFGSRYTFSLGTNNLEEMLRFLRLLGY